MRESLPAPPPSSRASVIRSRPGFSCLRLARVRGRLASRLPASLPGKLGCGALRLLSLCPAPPAGRRETRTQAHEANTESEAHHDAQEIEVKAGDARFQQRFHPLRRTFPDQLNNMRYMQPLQKRYYHSNRDRCRVLEGHFLSPSHRRSGGSRNQAISDLDS